jgi:hypothetical protein
MLSVRHCRVNQQTLQKQNGEKRRKEKKRKTKQNKTLTREKYKLFFSLSNKQHRNT